MAITGPHVDAIEQRILHDEAGYFDDIRADAVDELRDVAASEGVKWPPLRGRTFKPRGEKVPADWFRLPDPSGWDGKDPF